MKLNQATIDRFQRLLKVTEDDDPQKADFHFRIAELYDEQQRYNSFQARSLDQKIFDAKTPSDKAQPAGRAEAATRPSSGSGC